MVAHPDVYTDAIKFAHELRTRRSNLRVKMASATSLKAQMKKADISGAQLSVIIAQDEVANQQITIKKMATGDQITVASDTLFSENPDFI